jgi:hypothetical protein
VSGLHHALVALPPRKETLLSIGYGWVGDRASFNALRNTNMLPLLEIEPQTLSLQLDMKLDSVIKN